MKVKTANLLDFLSVPQKTSASLYEVLAKEAADAYEKHQTPPDQVIAKQAQDRGLNQDQIHRVVELSNHQINTVLSKSAEDQLFTFPVATVEGVIAYMRGGNKKTASAEDLAFAAPDFGVYDKLDSIPDYVDVLASRRFEQKLAAMVDAGRETPTESWSLEKAAESVQVNAAHALEKKAAADVEYAELEVRESLAGIRGEWQKVAESDSDGLEFLYAGAAVLGIPGAQQLAQALGENAQKLAAALETEYLELIGPNLDNEHPLVQRFSQIRSRLEALGAAKEAMTTTTRGALAYGATKGVSRAAGVDLPAARIAAGVALPKTMKTFEAGQAMNRRMQEYQ